jgi:hypothetical protein
MESLSKTLIKALLSGGKSGHGSKKKKIHYHSLTAVAIAAAGKFSH